MLNAPRRDAHADESRVGVELFGDLGLARIVAIVLIVIGAGVISGAIGTVASAPRAGAEPPSAGRRPVRTLIKRNTLLLGLVLSLIGAVTVGVSMLWLSFPLLLLGMVMFGTHRRRYDTSQPGRVDQDAEPGRSDVIATTARCSFPRARRSEDDVRDDPQGGEHGPGRGRPVPGPISGDSRSNA